MNRGKIGKRRAAIIHELTKGEGNRRRSAPKYKPSHRTWEMTWGPDGAPPAEPRFVAPAIVVHTDQEVHDA